MKKIFALILALLILTLVGCGKVDNTSSDIDTNSNEIMSSTNESSSTETSSQESTSTEISSEVSSAEFSKQESKPTSNAQNSSKKETSSSSNNKSNIPKYVEHTWDVDPETGEKIEGSDTYVTANGDVYDENGKFLYNLSEWGFYY